MSSLGIHVLADSIVIDFAQPVEIRENGRKAQVRLIFLVDRMYYGIS